jgi:hypothetical protein
MDTQYDFITPEFLHLIFFKQKNLIIYPYVDLKHLRGLEVFATGYTMIDLESTALYDIKEVITNDASSYSDGHTPNFYLIYNLDKKKAKELLDLKNVHCILNVNQIITDLLPADSDDTFIFYNKKTNQFLNYEFVGLDLKFEQIILSLAENVGMLRDELQRIKITANQLFIELNKDPESMNLSKILGKYDEQEFSKIFEFTQNFYNIKIPKDILTKKPRFQRNSHKIIDFSHEFNSIVEKNKRLREEFIHLLHNYRMEHVNESNLELRELYSPQLLYNYLRKHHWENGIATEFLKDWIQMNNTGYKMEKNDLLDFHDILLELSIPQEEINELILESTEDKDLSQQKKKIKQNEADKKKINIPESKIPSISNFTKFENWILMKLEEIEKNLK